MDVHKKIRELRKSKSLTQLEFAGMIGIKRNSLTQLELGKSKPTYEILEKIVSVFGIDANILFDFESDNHPDVSDNNSAHNAVKRLNPASNVHFNFYGRLNALKSVLLNLVDYEKLESLQSEINKTSNYINHYHSQFVDIMINEIEPLPPHVKDYKQFKLKHKNEIQSFHNLITTYEDALIQLENANKTFATKFDFLNIYDIASEN